MLQLTKFLVITLMAVLAGCSTLTERETHHKTNASISEKKSHASKPEDRINLLLTAVNQGNLEAVMACYEPGATLVVEPGKLATGTQAIREAFAGYIAMKILITPESQKIIQTSDTALFISKWKATGVAADGSAVQMEGTSSDVLRRQADGQWLIAIDNPFGVTVLK